MARGFAAASSQYLSGGAVITALNQPMTVSLWMYGTAGTLGIPFYQGYASHSDDYRRINWYGATDGRIAVVSNRLKGNDHVAFSTVTRSTGVWFNVVGVYASETLASIYIDGGDKQSATNTLAAPTYSSNQLNIGRSGGSSPTYYCNAYIAECGMWNVALTDAEVAILAKGYSPLMVRPQSLVAYWPLIGRTSPEIDLVSSYNMTLVNAPTAAAHQRIIYPPNMQSGLTIPGAPPAGAIMPQFQYANLGASLYNGTLIG